MTFDVGAAVEKLKSKFDPQILKQPQRTAYYPGSLSLGYRNAVVEVIGLYAETFHGRNLRFSDFHFKEKPEQENVSDEFEIQAFVDMSSIIPEGERRLICTDVEKGARAVLKSEDGSKAFRPSVQNVYVSYEERDTIPPVFMRVEGKTEPIPDNLSEFLSAVDFLVYTERWLKSSVAGRVKQIEDNLEALIESNKPPLKTSSV